MGRDGRVAPPAACADMKMSLGQDAEGTAKTPQCHCHTSVWVYQKCSLEFGWCSLHREWHCLPRLSSKDLELSPWYLLVCRNKSSVVPAEEHFLSVVAINLQSRVVISDTTVWCVKCWAAPIVVLQCFPNAALIWHSKAAKPLIAFVALIRPEVLQLDCLSLQALFSFAGVYTHIYLHLN